MKQLIYILPLLISAAFGVLAMMMLLDVRPWQMEKTKRITFYLGLLLILALNAVAVALLGIKLHVRCYMLFVHLPLAVLFWMVTKISLIKILFTLFTAVFLIFPVNLVSTLAWRLLSPKLSFLAVICYILSALLLLFLTHRFLERDFHYLVKQYNTRSFAKLFALPLVYNAAIYWVGKYNYSSSATPNSLILRGILFSITLLAYLLVLDIARTDAEKQSIKNMQTALSLKLESADHQISFLQQSQTQNAVYRHDIRHHLLLLSGLLTNGDVQGAMSYLRETQSGMDAITPACYSKNNTVNLIVSYFVDRAKKVGVTLLQEIRLPAQLALSETELCTMLSNGLENAISAATQIEDASLRTVRLTISVNRGKLLLFIQNAYNGTIRMEQGIPVAKQEGHGFGCQSMVQIAEKNRGICTFQAASGLFTLRVVLPMKEEPTNCVC
ncbi:MAG: GHKL domain-containing protein [Oscillospiraceae bacterium]|nr:GHKL domain-containing protein [Oscillospiraceae bacterium]